MKKSLQLDRDPLSGLAFLQSSKFLRPLLVFLAIGLFSNSSWAQQDVFQAPDRGLVSWLPAHNWEHALLSGNGTMGAMVMGHPHEETIILSHSALYLPQKRSGQPIIQSDRLEEIRKLILEGKYVEASKIPVEIREQAGYTDARDPFIPAFDIKINQEASNIQKYNRSTNFQTGETSVSWQDGVGTFQRKLFVSRADSVVVLSIKGTGKINCSIQFANRPVEWQQWQFVGNHIGEMKSSAEGQWLSYHSNFKQKYPGSLEAYEGLGRLVLKGGSSSVNGNQLIIKEADEVLLIVKIEPSYDQNPKSPKIRQTLLAIDQGYAELLANHVGIHGELFNRSKLELDAQPSDQALYTEEILLKAKSGVPLALYEKLYDAGRYNIISSSGHNPPNLQGIWTGTWTAPWTSGFTIDGNLATAISANMPTNMPELMDAFFRYHENLLADYKLSSKTLYGTRGIHVPAQITTHGWETDFSETWCLTFWTGGAGWTANFFFDYYQFTGDKDFLANRAYPFIKEALLFYEDFLTLDQNGKYQFNPSYSPENNPSNSTSQAALNATMDVMIAKQLLRSGIQSAQILNIDKDKIKVWQGMLGKMPTYQISEEGTLKEWLLPELKENHQHRHVSQLYGLFDEMDPDFKQNPVLQKAALRTLEEHLKFRVREGGGEMAFGLAQMASVAAHLGDQEKAYQMLQWLAAQYWSTGLGSFHNVGGLFNTDISGGVPYVITQMLAYSEVGQIYLLPALPNEWKKGSIEGLLLRGQAQIKKLTWEGNKLTVELYASRTQELSITLPRLINKISISNAMKVEYKPKKNKHFRLKLIENEVVKLDIEMM